MPSRYTIVLWALVLFPGALTAQAFSELDVNNVRARFYSDGMIGMSPSNYSMHFEAPAGAGAHPLFVANLWMGGMTPDNQLKLAAVMYNQMGEDWFPGTLTNDGSASITPAVSAQYDQVWTVSAADVALHIAYCQCLADPNCDETVHYPGYQAPAYFNDWPGNGDANLGQDHYLAPYLDLNGNGAYDPSACDAPCSRGDQSLFFIFNDKLGPHTETLCGPIGVEVRATPFAYDGPNAALSNTVFVQYFIKNQGVQTLHDFHVGLFTDFDLGCADDDFIGCDVERSLWYGYNADNNDEGNCNGATGYGPQPPAFGATILHGLYADADGEDYAPDSAVVAFNGQGTGDGFADNESYGLSHFIRFNNNASAMGNPENCHEYYNILVGRWRDGSPLTYGDAGFGGLVPARFAYPDASDPLGLGTGGAPQAPWSELTAASVPFDRRGIGSMGPITLEPGHVHVVLVAFVYARAGSGGPWASVQALQARVDSVRAFAEAQHWYELVADLPCDEVALEIASDADPVPSSLTIYPMPASGTAMVTVSVALAGQQFTIHDATGRVVGTHRLLQGMNAIDISSLARGVYACEVSSGKARYTGRLVKE